VPPEWFYERNFAPGITWFSGFELPDLSNAHPEQRFWLKNFLLNQLTHPVPSGKRELVFAQLRRAHASFDAYEVLRTSLRDYGTNPRSVSTYMALLDKTEIWLVFTAQAFELADSLYTLTGSERVYAHAAQPDLKRLHSFYIASKHVPGMVAGAQFKYPDPVSFWLTAKGLQSRRRGLLAASMFSHFMLQLAQESESFASYLGATAE